MTEKTFFYVVYSDSSRHGGGLKPKVMLTTLDDIYAATGYELAKAGYSLEDMAGISWIEDASGNMVAVRELTQEETLDLCVEKLGDDGRLYMIFPLGEEEAFLEQADYYGLRDAASALVVR